MANVKIVGNDSQKNSEAWSHWKTPANDFEKNKGGCHDKKVAWLCAWDMWKDEEDAM